MKDMLIYVHCIQTVGWMVRFMGEWMDEQIEGELDV